MAGDSRLLVRLVEWYDCCLVRCGDQLDAAIAEATARVQPDFESPGSRYIGSVFDVDAFGPRVFALLAQVRL